MSRLATPGVWFELKDHGPPEDQDVVFGWWCYWPDCISWEHDSHDQPDCATHWCALPDSPRPDPSKIQPGARQVPA